MKLGVDDFYGLWLIKRQIDDRHSNQRGEFHGSVVMRPGEGDAYLYDEMGKMRFGKGPILQATRRYNWHFHPDRVEVTFEDGKPFHSFVPDGRGNGTDHPCGDDYYRVQYDFTGWPNWTATWAVTGPRKDYTLVSHYSPSPSKTGQGDFKHLAQFAVMPAKD